MRYPNFLMQIGGRILMVVSALMLVVAAAGHIFPQAELALDVYHTHQRDIYLMDVGHNLHYRVTNGLSESTTPAWSPDGQHLAYIALGGDRQAIMVVDADGQNQRTLVTNYSGYMGNITLAWSPDNQHLAFTALYKTRQVIYVVSATPDADGQNALQQISFGAEDAFSPSWSPDGQKLVYSGSRLTSQAIFVATLSEQANPIADVRQLTPFMLDTTPVWSPDGSRIAFVSNRDGNNEIYVMKPDGSDATRVTYDTADDIEPTWTPDGRRIVFISNRTKAWEVYMVDATCQNSEACQSAVAQVTHNDPMGDKLRAVWRPPL